MRGQRNKTTFVLLVLAAGSFPVGLLGTVISMMHTFNKMSEADVIDPEDLSSSIWQAMSWTLAGLVVAAVLVIVLLVWHRGSTRQSDLNSCQ